MRSRVFITIVFTLTLTLTAQFANTSAPQYSAHLSSPAAGQVLNPGQVVRVEWSAVYPKVRFFESCEAEVWLSQDGGRTFPWRISPWLNAKTHSFNWTVPNLPTNAAVLDIRFGCDPMYPETYAPQPGSMFVIAKPGGN